jgi:1,4-alpha-glucan branching enzyme
LIVYITFLNDDLLGYIRKKEVLKMTDKNHKKRITFQFYAPEAGEIYLSGSFNGWDPTVRSLKQQKDGKWKTTVTLEPGVYEYRFIVDGNWQNDPQCEERRGNDFGDENSVLRV